MSVATARKVLEPCPCFRYVTNTASGSLGLATSADGVCRRDAGPVFEKDADVTDIECAYVHRFQPGRPWVMQADMGEFYLNDYQISLMNLAGPERLTGRIGFFGFDKDSPARDVKAWNSDPAMAGEQIKKE